MSIVNKEYLYSIDSLKKPRSVTEKNAIGLRLMELLMLNPGQDPLHPDMGVGLKNYRYGVKNLNELKKRIEDQIATYLPMYQSVSVALVRTPDKVCNIEINIGDMIFVYDSAAAPIPIPLDDIAEG